VVLKQTSTVWLAVSKPVNGKVLQIKRQDGKRRNNEEKDKTTGVTCKKYTGRGM